MFISKVRNQLEFWLITQIQQFGHEVVPLGCDPWLHVHVDIIFTIEPFTSNLCVLVIYVYTRW